MVARADFIAQHPEAIQAFVDGWMDGTTIAVRDPDQAAHLLVDNEPLYKQLGFDKTRKSLETVKLADLSDNERMFGLGSSAPLFDSLFQKASALWLRRGVIKKAVPPADAVDSRFVRATFNRSKATLPK